MSPIIGSALSKVVLIAAPDPLAMAEIPAPETEIAETPVADTIAGAAKYPPTAPTAAPPRLPPAIYPAFSQPVAPFFSAK